MFVCWIGEVWCFLLLEATDMTIIRIIIRTSPNEALNLVIGLTPIELFIEAEALPAASYLRDIGEYEKLMIDKCKTHKSLKHLIYV